MIPNNNLSVLPWYTSLEQQNARKWWLYNKIYPLYTPAGYLLPFQIILPRPTSHFMSYFRIYRADGTLVGTYTNEFEAQLQRSAFIAQGYDVLIYGGQMPLLPSMDNGQYYAELKYSGISYFSEIFTVVNDIEPYLKLEWWDKEDLVMEGGRIVYQYANNTQFRNRIFLKSDIAKPEYIFEEEGSSRDGFFFPEKQISQKKYRFSFIAAEYLLDVMRFIRLSDYVKITYRGKSWDADSFLITPEWQSEGDVAIVGAEFTAWTVAKKLGSGYIISERGDFNNDYNNDYLNT